MLSWEGQAHDVPGLAGLIRGAADHYHDYGSIDSDDGGDDDGLPAYSHQSYSRLVGIFHYDEGWENDTVRFPPCINLSSIYI